MPALIVFGYDLTHEDVFQFGYDDESIRYIPPIRYVVAFDAQEDTRLFTSTLSHRVQAGGTEKVKEVCFRGRSWGTVLIVWD